MLNLVEEVVEIELVLSEFLLQLGGLFLVELCLGGLYKRTDVAHTENTLGHTVGVENVEGFHLLAGTDELDGLVDHRLDGEGSTSTGVTIHLGEDYTVEIEFVVERLGGVHSILTGHGIHHEEDFVGVDGLFDVADLFHHLLIHGETTRGIHNHHIEAIGLGVGNRILGNLDRLFGVGFGIDRHIELFAQNLQLVDSGGTIHVACDEQRFAMAFVFQHVSQLGGMGGLTRTLQTCHQDDRRISIDVDVFGSSAHQLNQFVVGDFHHHLAGGDGLQHIHTQRFGFHLVGKFFRNLVTDVRIQKCFTHLLHGFRHVDIRNFSLSFQDFERPF